MCDHLGQEQRQCQSQRKPGPGVSVLGWRPVTSTSWNQEGNASLPRSETPNEKRSWSPKMLRTPKISNGSRFSPAFVTGVGHTLGGVRISRSPESDGCYSKLEMIAFSKPSCSLWTLPLPRSLRNAVGRAARLAAAPVFQVLAHGPSAGCGRVQEASPGSPPAHQGGVLGQER